MPAATQNKTAPTVIELDVQIRELCEQTQGLKGAVLARARPTAYARKLAELEAVMRQHYLLLYGENTSMP